MPKRRTVAVLYEIWWPEEEQLTDSPLGRPPDVEGSFGPGVHIEVYQALKQLGYRPVYQVLEGDTASLLKLARTPASMVFNLTESFAGDDRKDVNIAAYLELLDKTYTGSDASALHLGQDKATAKKILRYHGIPTPEFTVLDPGPFRWRARPELEFPLIVKPRFEDGSIGIDARSVVDDARALRRRVEHLHRRFGSDALVERYVEGREVYVSIVGNDRPEPLPVVEVDLSAIPDGIPRIVGTEIKWWKETEIYRQTPAVFPRGLSRSLTRKLQKTALAAYRALGLRDYGRVDMRLAPDGSVFVLEVNPNPWLGSESECVMAWEKTGRSYREFIGRIAELAYERRPR